MTNSTPDFIDCINCGHRNWVNTETKVVLVAQLTKEDIGLTVEFKKVTGILDSFEIKITKNGFEGYVDIEDDEGYDYLGAKGGVRMLVKDVTETITVHRPVRKDEN